MDTKTKDGLLSLGCLAMMFVIGILVLFLVYWKAPGLWNAIQSIPSSYNVSKFDSCMSTGRFTRDECVRLSSGGPDGR